MEAEKSQKSPQEAGISGQLMVKFHLESWQDQAWEEPVLLWQSARREEQALFPAPRSQKNLGRRTFLCSQRTSLCFSQLPNAESAHPPPALEGDLLNSVHMSNVERIQITHTDTHNNV